MKPNHNNINLYDFLVVSNCDYDTYDTEYDGIITCVGIDEEPTDKYEEFYQKMCKKVEVIRSSNGGLIVNWSNLIERNLEKFKEFTNKYWKYKYEDDDTELVYQWINEIHLFFAGYVGDNFYAILCEFADTLD